MNEKPHEENNEQKYQPAEEKGGGGGTIPPDMCPGGVYSCWKYPAPSGLTDQLALVDEVWAEALSLFSAVILFLT